MDIPAFILDRLEPRSRAKLLLLNDHAEGSHSATNNERLMEAFARRDRLEQERSRLASDRHTPNISERVEAIDAELVRANLELKRVQGVNDAAVAAWQAMQAPVQACVEFLKSTP